LFTLALYRHPLKDGDVPVIQHTMRGKKLTVDIT
jgi:hypothetical protein